jgi:hypothetical protein
MCFVVWDKSKNFGSNICESDGSEVKAAMPKGQELLTGSTGQVGNQQANLIDDSEAVIYTPPRPFLHLFTNCE